jgi:hypothetical protein
MLNPTINITFTDAETNQLLAFSFVHEVEIEKSRKTLTNTCKITLPRKIKVLNGDINTILKRGSKVSVTLGYEPNSRLEFTGYIARIDAKIPFVVYCEDEMWKLKQNNLSKAFKKVKLKEVIDFIYKGPSRVADLVIGDIVIKQQSTAQVLDALKKFALQAYFDADGVLVVDFAGSLKAAPIEVIYDFNKNVIDNNLEYTRKEDIRIKVKGTSKTATGKKIEFIGGDADGEERTLNYINIDQDDLRLIVNKELDKLKQDGYKNSFNTFGLPYAEPGYVAIMKDAEYQERDGSYLIEAVVTTSGVNGFRRKVTLERKLTA